MVILKSPTIISFLAVLKIAHDWIINKIINDTGIIFFILLFFNYVYFYELNIINFNSNYNYSIID